MNNHTASMEITVNVHESVLSRKLLFWTSKWKHVIKQDLYVKFPQIFLHTMYKYVLNCCKNFSDVCQVFQMLHHYTWRGGVCGHAVLTLLVYLFNWPSFLESLQAKNLCRMITKSTDVKFILRWNCTSFSKIQFFSNFILYFGSPSYCHAWVFWKQVVQ